MSARHPLGCGPKFPLAPSAEGRLLFREGTDKVRQSILLILLTEPGERVLRPDFGCGLGRYVMQPATTSTFALIERDVARALKIWEPRIRVRTVRVVSGPKPGLILIDVAYTHVLDGKPGSLAFPFSLE